MDLLALLYELLAKARKEGMMKLESDVEDPKRRARSSRAIPTILSNAEHDGLHLRLPASGDQRQHRRPSRSRRSWTTRSRRSSHEAEMPSHSLSRVGDALPALGIVAAVLGVVHALASADLPPAEMGALIAHAMVGTFLGVLLAYGFVSPLASLIEQTVSRRT
jgi:chemotaxis protein MotA